MYDTLSRVKDAKSAETTPVCGSGCARDFLMSPEQARDLFVRNVRPLISLHLSVRFSELGGNRYGIGPARRWYHAGHVRFVEARVRPGPLIRRLEDLKSVERPSGGLTFRGYRLSHVAAALQSALDFEVNMPEAEERGCCATRSGPWERLEG